MREREEEENEREVRKKKKTDNIDVVSLCIDFPLTNKAQILLWFRAQNRILLGPKLIIKCLILSVPQSKIQRYSIVHNVKQGKKANSQICEPETNTFLLKKDLNN